MVANYCIQLQIHQNSMKLNKFSPKVSFCNELPVWLLISTKERKIFLYLVV